MLMSIIIFITISNPIGCPMTTNQPTVALPLSQNTNISSTQQIIAALLISQLPNLQCPLCHTHFNKKSHIYRHIRQKHEQSRQYPCTFQGCDKKFKRGSHLKRHMISHTHEKKFKCLKCIMQFGYKHHLERHIKIIHEKEFYKCQGCGLQFNKKKALNKHKLECEQDQQGGTKSKSIKQKKIKKMQKNRVKSNECDESEDEQVEVEVQDNCQIFEEDMSQGHDECQKDEQDKMLVNFSNGQVGNVDVGDHVNLIEGENMGVNLKQNPANQNKDEVQQTLQKVTAQAQISDILSNHKVKAGGKTKKERSGKNCEKLKQKEGNKERVQMLYKCNFTGCLNAYKCRYLLKNHIKRKHPKDNCTSSINILH